MLFESNRVLSVARILCHLWIMFIVASLTKMVRRYWSKFSHVPFAITTYFTGRICSANERVTGCVYI